MFTLYVRMAAAFCFALFCSAAYADDCKLARLAGLDMSSSAYDAVLVPVSIGGTTKLMLIDTGSPLSAIQPSAIDELHLVTRRIYSNFMFDSAGRQFQYMAEIPSMQIGQMSAENLRFLVWPSQMIGDPRVAGTVGADLLRHYDIDLDFGTKKLGLFSQDHCPGQVVYWPADAVAVVPMHVVNSGHIIVPLTLDGHDMDAVLDTGASRSILSLEMAENIFDLKPNTPDLVPSGELRGSVGEPTYLHKFKSITLAGITINNPNVLIFDNLMKSAISKSHPLGSRLSDANESSGLTEMTLGMNELQNFHVYIAYREQKLYITARQPAAAASNPSPASVAATPSK